MMQRALRTPSLSFEPLMIQHAQGLLGVDDRVMSVIRSGLLGGLMQATKPVFAGEQLATLNLAALGYYAGVINMIEPGEPLQLANLYSWLADIVTAATSQALYGTANPIMTGSTLINDVW